MWSKCHHLSDRYLFKCFQSQDMIKDLFINMKSIACSDKCLNTFLNYFWQASILQIVCHFWCESFKHSGPILVTIWMAKSEHCTRASGLQVSSFQKSEKEFECAKDFILLVVWQEVIFPTAQQEFFGWYREIIHCCRWSSFSDFPHQD